LLNIAACLLIGCRQKHNICVVGTLARCIGNLKKSLGINANADIKDALKRTLSACIAVLEDLQAAKPRLRQTAKTKPAGQVVKIKPTGHVESNVFLLDIGASTIDLGK